MSIEGWRLTRTFSVYTIVMLLNTSPGMDLFLPAQIKNKPKNLGRLFSKLELSKETLYLSTLYIQRRKR